MITNLYKSLHNTLWMLLLIFCFNTVYGQQAEYNNGVKQRIVKVKFSNQLSKSVRAMRLEPGNKPVTGISSFDAVSFKYEASGMRRLFPKNPNPKLEAKLQKHGLDMWYVVDVAQGSDPEVVAKAYRSIAEVTNAEVEHKKILAPYQVKEYKGISTYSTTAPFDDPYLPDQWHYDNNGQTGYENGSDVNLFSAWETTAGSNEIIVSIHDEGIDVEHPDLAANMWVNEAELNGVLGIDDDGNGFIDDIHGWNFDNENGQIDGQFHGTHVAGTVAAVNNNGYGVAGVAGGTGNNDGIRLMSLQIMGGGSIEESYIYAADNGAVISQNSWGYSSPGVYDQSVLDAIDYFIAEAGDYEGSPMKGGIVIFAAGNSAYDAEWYPGYYDEVLSVSAIGPNWERASYSNFGTWVDIAAPGGEMGLGSKNGVLSTLPNEQFGYLEGTSMACPHVSGIAALVLANRTSQLTSEVLWNKLVSGVVDIDSHNPGYEGKLGSGHIDAYLAIQNDEGIAPNTISDLAVAGISQEFVNLSWTVPADSDDEQPSNFRIYYSSSPLTPENLGAASYDIIENDMAPGVEMLHTVEGLYGLTKYYFAVVSGDRWNNLSALSNVVEATTNEGPEIAVDAASENIVIDVDVTGSTIGTHDITISNNAEGVLRWDYLTRHKSTALAYSIEGIRYPQMSTQKLAYQGTIGMRNSSAKPSAEVETSAYTTKQKSYIYYTTNIIGENDVNYTNSSATRFVVDDVDGFNLTHVQMYLKHDPALGPVVLEVYKGSNPNKQNLVYAQEHSNWGTTEEQAYITLDEQLYMESGSTFWIVFHVPSGNLYPLGIGPESSPEYSTNCYISFDMGQSWGTLEDAIDSKDYAWSTIAISSNAYLGEYLTLNPASGEVAGLDNQVTTLSADASPLINGTYQANIILRSNDAANKEMRLPVTLNVLGQVPSLQSSSTLDFGSVFSGTTKEMNITIKNTGLGNYNDLSITSTNPDFEVIGWYSQIAAQGEINVTVKYSPDVVGNDNGFLNVTSFSSPVVKKIVLFGVSTAPAELTVNPETQLVDNITIGDEVNASITVENTGASALRYFVPGYDESGVSDEWEEVYHSYGYKFRTSYVEETNPISFDFQDISSTGTNITDYFIQESNRYYSIDMGFNFPYYTDQMTELFISSKGFTVFDDEFNPINTPRLNGAPWSPKGYISAIGGYTNLSYGGEIFYQVDPDKVIIQYENVTDGWSGSMSVQIVLYADGNIRFYYDDITFAPTDLQYYMNILIEDYQQTDGILIYDYEHVIDIYNGLALGFDYPGPDIITSITSAGGVLLPGESAQLDITMETGNLYEGLINRYVNIVSNDPFDGQKIAQIQLNIIDGGTADLAISTTEISFGDVFQGATASQKFSIKNNGTAPSTITDFTLDNGAFTINGTTDATIKPGLAEVFEVVIPTGTIANLTDVINITTTEGGNFMVNLSGNVLDPPAINVDLATIDETLAYGETSQHVISFENTGLAELEVTATGNEWMTMTSSSVPSSRTYTFTSSNDGTKYQWLDIRQTGEQLPFPEDLGDPLDYFPLLELAWPASFYGEEYSSMYVGQNGLITFDTPDVTPFFPDETIPSEMFETLIAPYWSFGGFPKGLYPDEEIGIFYYHDDKKMVISWEYLIDNFGGIGSPMSAQVIFYRNGSMKFQYKVNGSLDFLSGHTIIGLQDGVSEPVLISQRSTLVHGSGLAYIISPADTYTVASGSTLNAEINIDARNVYAGNYADVLTINTNVPGSEVLEKPVNLTVTGEADIAASVAEIDFGSIMAYTIDDEPANYSKEFSVQNTGVASLDLAGMNMESFSEDFMLEMYVYDSWFGSWYWSDVSWIWSWPSLKPGEEAKFRITFTPSSAGSISDNVVVSSALDPMMISVLAEVSLPPVLNVQTAEVYTSINEVNGTDTKMVVFDNTDGQGDLTYELSIDYQRTSASTNGNEKIGTQAELKLAGVEAFNQSNEVSVQANEDFNRVLAYEDKETADSFLGYEGAAAFQVATRFNSGSEGYNVTHIKTFYNAVDKKEGTIQYEIRAGGGNVAEAAILTSGSASYSFTGDERESGEWLTIAIDDPQVIYPNENFYVVITYPFEIYYPQGVDTNAENVAGRFMYSFEGTWYDVQDPNGGYPGVGWMMRAAEETFVSGSWLSITSLASGTIPVGESVEVALGFEAAYGSRGDQHASLVINSNDPFNNTATVPVTMHINEAPVFDNVPTEVVLSESVEKEIIIGLMDSEDNAFTVSADSEPVGMAYEVVGEQLQITFSPGYDDAGEYAVTFTAIDEFDAESQMTLNIYVENSNRAPEVILNDELAYAVVGQTDQRNYTDYFMDPDGDEMTYNVSIANDSIATVFHSKNRFIVETTKEGETEVTLTATDSHGAMSNATLVLSVGTSVVNNAPEVLKSDDLVYTSVGFTDKLIFTDYFSDADGDDLSFKVMSNDESVALTFSTDTGFTVLTVAEGSTSIVLTATDTYGASTEVKLNVSVSIVLGTEDLGYIMSIYPNPANEQVQISWGPDWNGKVLIEVINLQGVRIFSKTFEISNRTSEINISQLKSGVYVLRASNQEKTSLIKLIKE
ncbi:MAG TPA: S8 family serine peptidase [Fulvivirga sp.]|nr:S8 family serine peptidase [Fulvivirga sp.]